MASDPKAPDQPDQPPADALTPVAPASSNPAEDEAPRGTGAGDDVLTDSALGRGLVKAWETARGNSNWVFILFIGAMALWFAYNWRTRSNLQAQQQAKVQLVAMRQAADVARQLRARAAQSPEDVLSRQVTELDTNFGQAFALVQNAPGGAPPVAWRVAGDYYWYLATLPIPMPATRPNNEFVPLKASEARLDQAAEAFGKAVDSEEATSSTRFAARFGLASVAEERGAFDQAREQYERLLEDDALPTTLRQEVEARIATLDTFNGRSPLVAAPPPNEDAGTPNATGDLSSQLDDLLGSVTEDLSLEVPTTRPTTRPLIEALP